jgi:hypothetical protein
VLDLDGNDSYRGDDRVQGSGVTGIAVLLDAAGEDRYYADGSLCQAREILHRHMLSGIGRCRRH